MAFEWAGKKLKSVTPAIEGGGAVLKEKRIGFRVRRQGAAGSVGLR